MSRLVTILQKAHAGENAAYLAYEGHWRSLSKKNPSAAETIKDIQKDEWFHRQSVGFMLIELDARPSPAREALMWLIGKTTSALCYVSGNWASAVGAEMIEKIGSVSYWEAAELARDEGYPAMATYLEEMARTEEEHETFFKLLKNS